MMPAAKTRNPGRRKPLRVVMYGVVLLSAAWWLTAGLVQGPAPGLVSGPVPGPVSGPVSGPPPGLVAGATPAMSAAEPMAAHAQEPDPSERRLFSPEDLGLLEGPDREAWQRPDQIMDALGIADGSIVADLGAGGGWFTVRLARRVGPNGIVYAEDIQQQMIDSTRRRVDREGLPNVRYRLGTATDPKLPAGALDAALMVDIYQEVEHKVELLRNVRQALTPAGRLGIVNFTKDGGGPGPAMETRVDPEDVAEDAQAAGLRLLAHESFLPYQYLLILGK